MGSPTWRLVHLDHNPIKPAFRKFLRFTVREEVFQFKALPFGLTSALRGFTRVTATLAFIVHRKGINLHLYLNDWLLRARSFERCLHHTREVVKETTDLGFIVNLLEVQPSTYSEVLLLEEDFDLVEGLVQPTHEDSSPLQNSQEASVSGGEISSESLRRDECIHHPSSRLHM